MRTILLALFALSLVLVSSGPAMAQAPTKPPNILVIWGDDIGYWNISAYNQGMMGYKTPEHRPHRQGRRAVHRLVRAAELHRRPRVLHHRPGRLPHRPAQGRPAGREGRPAGARRDDRRVAQGAGLHDRPVRQEPPRRPRRAPAHRARLRRVLRLALPPQRRGRARASRLLQGSRAAQAIRDARRDPHLGQPGRHAEDREHRPAHQEAHGDGRRGIHHGGARASWRTRRRRTSRSSCGGTRPACTSGRGSRRRAQGKTGLGIYPDGMVEHDGHGRRSCSTSSRSWASTTTPS